MTACVSSLTSCLMLLPAGLLLLETQLPTCQQQCLDRLPRLCKGLPTDEGLFGFKPFPEVWVGR